MDTNRELAPPRLLIQLLGGRIQPAAVVAYQLQPDVIACITSHDKPATVAALKRVVAQQFPALLWTHTYEVHPYVPSATRQAIEDILQTFPNHTPIISLTGAPMPMAIGAYEMARRLDCPAYYLNSAQGQLLDFAHDGAGHSLTIKLTVDDYLTIYGMQTDPRRPPASLAYATAPPPALPAPAAHQRQRRGQVDGHWLEAWIYHVAVNTQWEGAPLFDSCAAGLRYQSQQAEREIDFIGIRRGIALVASCKTGKESWKKIWLDELVSVTKNLGDNYCTKLYITDALPPVAGSRQARAFTQFRQQADNARIVVVTGADLPKFEQILCHEVTDPTYPGN
jgi:hypothetical protein